MNDLGLFLLANYRNTNIFMKISRWIDMDCKMRQSMKLYDIDALKI